MGIHASELIHASVCRSYDAKLQQVGRSMKISNEDLPGALALMQVRRGPTAPPRPRQGANPQSSTLLTFSLSPPVQEIGQYEAVIATATALLEDKEGGGPDACDVACSLSLAYWDRALICLPENVLQACEDLEKALALCRRYQVRAYMHVCVCCVCECA
jgi:hypothetical protein